MSRLARLCVAAALGGLAGCQGLDTATLNPFGSDQSPAAGQEVVTQTRSARRVIIPATQDVAGKPSDYLEQMFGAPDLRRREPGAQFWTYSHPQCTVYFILYADTDEAYFVHHIEADRHVRDQRALEAQLDACMSDIAHAHQDPTTDAGS